MKALRIGTLIAGLLWTTLSTNAAAQDQWLWTRDYTNKAIAAGQAQLAQVADPREKLRRIALLHLERLGADRDLAVVFQVELRGSTKFMEEFSAAGFAEYLNLIRSTFEEGQRAGVFRSELNAKVVAKILFGALDEMATNWILSKRRYKLAPMADQVLDIFLNGVSAK